MLKSILLHVNLDDGQNSRLEAALDLVRIHEGHLTCLQATPFYSYGFAADAYAGTYGFPQLYDEIRAQELGEQERIEQRLRREGLSWDWIHADGSAAHLLVEQAKLADLIVVSRPVGGEPTLPRPLPLAADVAIHSRAPVLAVPVESRNFDCAGPAAIAWNGSLEAAHALRLALPMIRCSSAVHLLTVSEGDRQFPATDASSYLARHGVPSELHEIAGHASEVAGLLAERAAELGASYLVMGAYGHSRLREKLLGGVTRELLLNSPVPLVLAH